MSTLLGARIKHARVKRKLSSAGVARSIGMDRGQYHRLENADNADPSFATVVRIARKLDVSLDWLALSIVDEQVGENVPKFDAASRALLLAAADRIKELLSEGTLPGSEVTGDAKESRSGRKSERSQTRS